MDETLSDQEQWEWLKKQVRENYLYVLAGIALAAAAIYGYRWYQQRVENQLLAAGKIYEQLLKVQETAEVDAAVKLRDQLNTEHAGTGYAEQATLVTSRLQLIKGQQAAALESLQKLMNTSNDKEMALLARLRAARIQIDQNQADAALQTLAQAEPGAMAANFAEVRGDALYRKGERNLALKAYEEAAALYKTADAESAATDFLTLKIASLR